MAGVEREDEILETAILISENDLLPDEQEPKSVSGEFKNNWNQRASAAKLRHQTKHQTDKPVKKMEEVAKVLSCSKMHQLRIRTTSCLHCLKYRVQRPIKKFFQLNQTYRPDHAATKLTIYKTRRDRTRNALAIVAAPEQPACKDATNFSTNSQNQHMDQIRYYQTW